MVIRGFCHCLEGEFAIKHHGIQGSKVDSHAKFRCGTPDFILPQEEVCMSIDAAVLVIEHIIVGLAIASRPRGTSVGDLQ